MSETKYLKKKRNNYNKSEIIKGINNQGKTLLNNHQSNENSKRSDLKRIFESPEFQNLALNGT